MVLALYNTAPKQNISCYVLRRDEIEAEWVSVKNDFTEYQAECSTVVNRQQKILKHHMRQTTEKEMKRMNIFCLWNAS